VFAGTLGRFGAATRARAFFAFFTRFGAAFGGDGAEEARATAGACRGRAVFAFGFRAVLAGEGPARAASGRIAVFAAGRRGGRPSWSPRMRALPGVGVLGMGLGRVVGGAPGLVRGLDAGANRCVDGAPGPRVGGGGRAGGCVRVEDRWGSGDRLGRRHEDGHERDEREGQRESRCAASCGWLYVQRGGRLGGRPLIYRRLARRSRVERGRVDEGRAGVARCRCAAGWQGDANSCSVRSSV
jgi:hypothetical protein